MIDSVLISGVKNFWIKTIDISVESPERNLETGDRQWMPILLSESALAKLFYNNRDQLNETFIKRINLPQPYISDRL